MSEDGLSSPDSVKQALFSFMGVKNRFLRWVLWILPLIIILMESYNVYNRMIDFMHISGMITVAIGIYAFQFFWRSIPETLGDLWDRNIVMVKPTISHTGEITGDAPNLINPTLDKQYRT